MLEISSHYCAIDDVPTDPCENKLEAEPTLAERVLQ